MSERKCRICGCTQDKACVTAAGPCHWVELDLCSACAAMSDAPPRELTVLPEDVQALESMPRIPVELDGVTGLFLLSALQLACRHPGLNGVVHETVYDFARGLQNRISVTPSLAAICEAGWEPASDVPVEPKPKLILPGDPEFGL